MPHPRHFPRQGLYARSRAHWRVSALAALSKQAL